MSTSNDYNNKKYFYIFLIYYWVMYMSIAVFNPYIGIYYMELGYSSSTIGILAAVGPIAAILTQPIWGLLSDGAKYRRTILQIALFGCLIASLLFTLSDRYIYIFFVTFIYMTFFTSGRPMEDAIALDYVQNTRFRFAPIRLSGTLGFAFMMIFTGRMFGEHISRMFVINALLLVLTISVSFLLPKTGASKSQKGSIRIWDIFSNKELLFVLGYCFIVYAALGFYGSFISVYMKSFGATNTQIGWGMALSALSEVPILIFIDKAIKKFGSRNILLFSGFMTALRMLVFSQATGVGLIIIGQLMQGVTFITIYYCSVTMVSSRVPDQLRSTGQAFLALITGGLSRIMASIGGGYLSDTIGMDSTFYLSFWIVLVTTAVLVGYFFIKRDTNNKGYTISS